jgi:hypothetical protein
MQQKSFGVQVPRTGNNFVQQSGKFGARIKKLQ